MAKSKLQYACSECGAQSSKWSGQCGDCGAWNSLVEVIAEGASGKRHRFAGYAGQAAGNRVQTLAEVAPEETLRMGTGLEEFDRVLGGGLVAGAVILIGGDPGIGKSTLLLQTLVELAQRARVLYVTGEESLQQVSLRAQRLRLRGEQCSLLSETRVEAILAIAQQEKPQVMVVDSIQTIFTDELQSAPGSVAQVRESAAQLVRFAKQSGTALFLVGHVTKEGTLAGPRVLEHMVDTVLYFEGDPNTPFRVIRAIKNRFGAINELGAFAMTETGLRQVTNPSAIFLSRHDESVPGSVVMVTREGTRPLLVEVQVLVAESHLAAPRRVAVGLDTNRLAMLLAVLQRHGGIALYDHDVFVNVVGGMRITETAADLPVVLAALSTFRNRPFPKDCVVFGELGLAGEIRPVQNGQDRLREAQKHGFTRAIIPHANAPKGKELGIELIPVKRLPEALEYV
jgi:DNA repair protein RadA/Sms